MKQVASTLAFTTLQPAAAPKDQERQNYAFTVSEIDRVIRKKSPGYYALGYLDEQGQFAVRAIGRADEDLRDELSVRLTLLMAADLIAGPEDDLKARYSRFTFEYTKTAEEAFENECLEYHRLADNLEDKRHPSREENNALLKGNGPRWFCPIWQCAWNY